MTQRREGKALSSGEGAKLGVERALISKSGP